MGVQQRKVMTREQKVEVQEKGLTSFPNGLPINDPDLKERAYELWVGAGGRNCHAVRGLLELEAEPGDPIPSITTIRTWSKTSYWANRADVDLGFTAGSTMAEIQMKYRAILLGGADVLLRAQTGGYRGREMEGALAVKATEVGMKVIKDGFVVPSQDDQKPQIHAKVLTPEEEEAAINSQLIRRKG